jgi:hypothetical protein
MYYDDPYDPNLPNDYDDDTGFQPYCPNDSDVESTVASTVNTATKKKRKLYEDSKSIDKGYFSLKMRIDHKLVKLEYYHTPSNPGAKIRNAITGIYEDFRVGKKEEDLFFKVGTSAKVGNACESHLLFYDSPQQYEQHFGTMLSETIKNKWLAKSTLARELYVKESDEKTRKNEAIIR